MTFEEFEQRAQEMLESIPALYRGGIEYVAVERRTVPHAEIPDVYTLGECATGELDLGGEMPEEVRSGVHLYYGSFSALAKLDEEFDWEGELWETLTHEIRHHRESTAGEDALEDFDHAADENFKRREGKPFDPEFYRAGEPVGEDAWDVDGDVFVEIRMHQRDFDAAEELHATVAGRRVSLPRPELLGDVCFLYLDEFGEGKGDTAVVVVRRRGLGESIRSLFHRDDPDVVAFDVAAGDWWIEDETEGAPSE